MMRPEPPIDAVLLPAGYGSASARAPYWALAQLAAEFAPLLGVRVLHTRQLLDGRTLIGKSLDETLNYPQAHPRAGEPRYTWSIRPQDDGVLYGRRVGAD